MDIRICILVLLYYNIQGGNSIEVIECIGSESILKCGGDSTIKIAHMQLGDSRCFGAACCPRGNDCMGSVSVFHLFNAKRKCDGERLCTVNVEKRDIGCGLFFSSNDYEKIVYDCIPASTSTTTTTMTPALARTMTTTLSPAITQVMTQAMTPTMTTTLTPAMTQVMTQAIAPTMTPSGTALSTQQQSKEGFNIDTSSRLTVTKQKDNTGLDTLNMNDEPRVEHMYGIQDHHQQQIDFERIVIIIVGGVILMTIIVSLTCLLIRKMYLRSKTKQTYLLAQTHALPRPPIDPPSFFVSYSSDNLTNYSTLQRTRDKDILDDKNEKCKAEQSSDLPHCVPNVYHCETYDSIGEIDMKLNFDTADTNLAATAAAADIVLDEALMDDGYLKPDSMRLHF